MGPIELGGPGTGPTGPQGPGVDDPEFPAGLPTNVPPMGPDPGPQGTNCGGPPPPGVCGGPGDGPGNVGPGNPGVPGPGMPPFAPVGVDGPGGVPYNPTPGPPGPLSKPGPPPGPPLWK